jgi:hypothetical protein
MTESDRWRTAAISLAFLLVFVCVAWVMRERSIAADRRREREHWKADRALIERGHDRSENRRRL